MLQILFLVSCFCAAMADQRYGVQSCIAAATSCLQGCPCQNGGVCKVTVSGIVCDCQPGFSGVVCEDKYLTKKNFNSLEKKVAQLVTQQAVANQEIGQLRKKLDSIREGRWRLHRTNEALDKLNQLKLHQVTPTYIQAIPDILPNNTQAVILSVFCNFWNTDGHAYLNYETHQKGNTKPEGKVYGYNTHFRVYANTFYYEQMVPWTSDLTNELVFKVTSSYQTGGPKNWYTVRLVGYITSE